MYRSSAFRFYTCKAQGSIKTKALIHEAAAFALPGARFLAV